MRSETRGVRSPTPGRLLHSSILKINKHCGFPRRSPIQVLTRQMLLNFNNARTGILPFSYWEKTKFRWRAESLVLHIPMPPNAKLRQVITMSRGREFHPVNIEGGDISTILIFKKMIKAFTIIHHTLLTADQPGLKIAKLPK